MIEKIRPVLFVNKIDR